MARLTPSVYVGKYKGRKVAISEFREHLSESELTEGSFADPFSGFSRTQAVGRVQPPEHCQIRECWHSMSTDKTSVASVFP
jgi:hypothetical protein